MAAKSPRNNLTEARLKLFSISSDCGSNDLVNLFNNWSRAVLLFIYSGFSDLKQIALLADILNC